MSTTESVGATSLLAHGAVPAAARLPDGDRRFDDHELSFVRLGEIAVLVEAVDPARSFRVRDDLLVHSEVLNTLATQWPVIPFAFGAALRDEEDVRSQLLEPHEARLREQLDALTGCVQFTLRATYLREPLLGSIVSEHTKIARLREQTRDRPDREVHAAKVRLGELVDQAVDDRRRQDLDEIVETIGPIADDHRVAAGSGLDDIGDISFLVRATHQNELERTAEQLAERLAGRARLRLIGPLAAFDFVGDQDGVG